MGTWGNIMKIYALSSKPSLGKMNQTEAAYSAQLELLRRSGQIARWDFEPVKLRLADRTFYTPDFRVIDSNGAEEYHEVKGFFREDAAVKIKVAAEQHPYPFFLVKKTKQGFTKERI